MNKFKSYIETSDWDERFIRWMDKYSNVVCHVALGLGLVLILIAAVAIARMP